MPRALTQAGTTNIDRAHLEMRAVDVVFEEYGLPGRRRPVAVLSCSAFDPSTDVRCPCQCLNCAGRVPLAEAPKTEAVPPRS